MTREPDAAPDHASQHDTSAATRPAAQPQSQAQIARSMTRQRGTDLLFILGAIAVAVAFAMFSGGG